MSQHPRAITTTDAPAPFGHYEQAVRVGDTVYVSGQVGLDPHDGSHATDAGGQTRQVVANLAAILAEAGCGLEGVAMLRVHVADLDDAGAVDDVLRELLPRRPARTTVQVGLPPSVQVEIDAVAVVTISDAALRRDGTFG